MKMGSWAICLKFFRPTKSAFENAVIPDQLVKLNDNVDKIGTAQNIV